MLATIEFGVARSNVKKLDRKIPWYRWGWDFLGRLIQIQDLLSQLGRIHGYRKVKCVKNLERNIFYAYLFLQSLHSNL